MLPLQVDGSVVAEIISAWTGIPLGRMVKDEIRTVRQLQPLLAERVIGQDHALAAIAQRVRTASAKLEDPNKPRGVFMFVGPSGVGKTETALALADILYGGERKLITINMSEYQEAHSVSGLKGSPPGYVGYGEGGVLTESRPLRQRAVHSSTRSNSKPRQPESRQATWSVSNITLKELHMSRPVFSSIWAGLKAVQSRASTHALLQRIGGEVAEQADRLPSSAAGAVRMSHVLNASGTSFNTGAGAGLAGADGQRYPTSASDLARQLRRRWGAADAIDDEVSAEALAGRRGVLLSGLGSHHDVRGRATLWDGSACADAGVFPASGRRMFWQLR